MKKAHYFIKFLTVLLLLTIIAALVYFWFDTTVELWNHVINQLGAGLENTATILSAFATVAIAVLTMLLWKENRLLRKAGSNPMVVAHFDIHPDGTGGVNMSLSNIGTGPALDVSFEIQANQENFNQYSIQLDVARKRAPMTLIAQEEKVSFLFGVSFNLFRPKNTDQLESLGSKPLDPFEVIVKWRAVGREAWSQEKYVLDISQYAGLPGMMNKPPSLKIVEELQGIKKQLSKITGWEHSMVDLVDATKPDQTIRALLIAPRYIHKDPE